MRRSRRRPVSWRRLPGEWHEDGRPRRRARPTGRRWSRTVPGLSLRQVGEQSRVTKLTAMNPKRPTAKKRWNRGQKATKRADPQRLIRPFSRRKTWQTLSGFPPPTQHECRLLWAGLLEIQDEEAMREDTAAALLQDGGAMPGRVRLAARHRCRVRRLLHGRSTTGLLRLAIALPNLLSGVQEAVAEEIEHVVQSRQTSRGTKRQRADAQGRRTRSRGGRRGGRGRS